MATLQQQIERIRLRPLSPDRLLNQVFEDAKREGNLVSTRQKRFEVTEWVRLDVDACALTVA
jgi:hypothetical protein